MFQVNTRRLSAQRHVLDAFLFHTSLRRLDPWGQGEEPEG